MSFRLLFDECVGKPAMDAIHGVVKLGPLRPLEMRHVLEYQRPGTPDSKWIPALAADGNWIVLTSDSGKSGRGGLAEKLPLLCLKHSVSHVILSPTMHLRPAFAKSRAILNAWEDIAAIMKHAAGSRFSLRGQTDTEAWRGQLVLIEPKDWELRELAPKSQQKLFEPEG